MDEEQEKPAAGAAADDGLQRWRELGARHDTGAGYWQTHVIVPRSENDVRRGEAPAYVRPRS